MDIETAAEINKNITASFGPGLKSCCYESLRETIYNLGTEKSRQKALDKALRGCCKKHLKVLFKASLPSPEPGIFSKRSAPACDF